MLSEAHIHNMILKGRIFISTRPSGRSEELKNELHKVGAKLIEWPLIRISKKELTNGDKKIIQNIKLYDWLIFTSINAVQYFFEALRVIPLTENKKLATKIAVFGNKTSKMLNELGYKPDYKADSLTGKDFAIELNRTGLFNDKSVLFPCGNLAPETLESELNRVSIFNRLEVYSTEKPETIDDSVFQIILNDAYDMIIFTSPSGFNNFYVQFGSKISIHNLRIACIGKTTAFASEEKGVKPLVVSSDNSMHQLSEAIINYYRDKFLNQKL